MNTITTAVIGIGSLGQHHARIMAQHPLSNLTFLVDTEVKRRDKLGAQYKVRTTAQYQDIIGSVQAAVIAVPTPAHFTVARDLLNAGIHCLVEKPFTSSVAEAEELIALAQKKNLVLQVGHIERFNPAVVAARPFVKDPKFVEVNRLGPYDPRTSHIGVVLDLMIHDLDILLTLIHGKITGIEANGAKILSDHEDIAKVRIKFEGGCVADISASRVSLEKYRKIRIFQPDNYISIDYAGRSLKIYRKKADVGVVKTLGDIEVVKPKLRDDEPLYHELDHFLACVAEGRKPAVTGEHGRDALDLALTILKKLNEN